MFDELHWNGNSAATSLRFALTKSVAARAVAMKERLKKRILVAVERWSNEVKARCRISTHISAYIYVLPTFDGLGPIR